MDSLNETGYQKLLSRLKERAGRLYVFSGPSGVGKDTVLDLALAQISGVARSVSATTRAPRPAEINGVDYYFLTREHFLADIACGKFLEYAPYGTELYGTPLEGVQQQRKLGIDVVLKIEVKGALLVRRSCPEAILIFVGPPDLPELERRLRGRNTDPEEKIQARLQIARDELAQIPEYDYLVINDDLASAVDQLCAIFTAERLKLPNADIKKPLSP